MLHRILFLLAFGVVASSGQANTPFCQMAKSEYFVNELATSTAGRPFADSLKLGIVQYPIEYDLSIPRYLDKVEGYVRRAAAEGAELVVLPELAMLDLLPKTAVDEARFLRDLAPKLWPEIEAKTRALAAELEVSILSGSYPRPVDGKIFNTALLVLRDGRVIMQDKIFLTPDEVAWQWSPGDTLQVFDAPWGKTSILICYDCQFPVLSQKLAPISPDLLLIPSMTGEHGYYRVKGAAEGRAIEHHAYAVVTGTVSADREYVGQAAVFHPYSKGFDIEVQRGELNADQILYSTLDLAHLRRSKVEAGLFSGRDQTQRRNPIYLEVSEGP